MSPAPSLAQQNDDGDEMDAEPMGQCMASLEPHECEERCPSFETCFIAAGGGRLYYQVEDQRFDCDGLECGEASQRLSDYCCERGEFAPESGGGGGGGCSLAPGSGTTEHPGAWLITLASAALVGARRRRVRQ